MTARLDEVKRIAVEFFHWWYNQPGTNTQEGFDEWLKSQGYNGPLNRRGD